MTSIIEKRLSLHQLLAQKEEENLALKAQNTQLQILANLGSATAMIAHEINNLLTPLTTYTALAMQNPEDRELAARVLDRTARNCQRASRIMDSLLAVANGRRQQRQTVALQAVVDDVFTCLCRDFAKDGIRVETQIPETLQVECVPVQIEQVLMNLILNAREALLPEGGLLRIAAAADARCVDITVSDTGTGIAQEDLKNIFRPFFTTKARSDGSSVKSGSGVGLAFCKRIIDSHAGEIHVDSALGKGTTFTIRLPSR